MGRRTAISILEKYYPKHSDLLNTLTGHGDAIAAKAARLLARNPHLTVDRTLIEEAAYLHDIGISETAAESIGCFGPNPYLKHGILGKARLEREGLPSHARIAERHIGVGLTREDIERGGLPLPKRDMVPETLEEEILCFLDLFFSKTPGRLAVEKPKAEVQRSLARFGERQVRIFDSWCRKFNE